jgi:hypothetical protein
MKLMLGTDDTAMALAEQLGGIRKPSHGEVSAGR